MAAGDAALMSSIWLIQAASEEEPMMVRAEG